MNRTTLLSPLLAPVGVAVALVVGGSGCFDLDSFVLNPRHCSLAEDAAWQDSTDCTERHVCAPCDAPLDWESAGVPVDDVIQVTTAVSGGETIDGYFIRSAGARPNDVVIYAHGNFGGIEHYLNRVRPLYALGVNLYVVDYRGFGKSSTPDEPDEATFMEDARKQRDALDAVLEAEGILAPRLSIYGYSAGALSAVEMATYRAPCGILLEAPFPSVQSLADDSTFVGVPQSFLTRGSWDNLHKMADVHAPLLQLHGDSDAFIRIEVGQQVFDAANDPKQLVIVEGAVHGNGGHDVPTAMGPAYGETLTTFLDGLDCSE